MRHPEPPRRAAVVAAVALVTLATALFSSAQAAPSAAGCARFNDDQRGVIEENFGEPHRDMLGGRLSSDGTHLTAVVRVGLVRAGAPQPDDRLLNYTFGFTVGSGVSS